MDKSLAFFTPYSSIFDSYPHLCSNISSMAPTTVPKLTAEQHARIIAIGKAIRATNYPNKEEQRAFLDEKVFEYVRCSFCFCYHSLIS